MCQTCRINRLWISSRGSCRTDRERIIMLVHSTSKRLSIVSSYSGTVANGPTEINSTHVNQDLEIGPAGRLGDQGPNGT